MAFNIKASLDAIASHVARTGYVSETRIGEPTSPPDAVDKIQAAILMQSAAVVDRTLSTTVEQRPGGDDAQHRRRRSIRSKHEQLVWVCPDWHNDVPNGGHYGSANRRR